MTDIKIKRLSLENFKCHKALTLLFNGGNASIYGDNATGKTSIYDALTWLLFGKDSQGNGEKNIEIKPLDASGNVADHDAMTAVEAVLDVSGEEVSLRRTYKEVWTTKRGSSEATYDGNTSEYYVSGVPCKKNAFQDKVSELVSEDTFRMLTSVSHFAAGISWQDRRAVLFQVAGVMDDQQILATNEAFSPLVESMGKLSLEDYKKKLLSEKRKFVGAKTEIPARISECQKTIEDVEGLDYAGAKAEVEALTHKKEGIEAQILAIEHDNAAEQKRLEIREAELEMKALYNENKAYRASQTAGATDLNRMRSDLSGLNMRIARIENSVTGEVAYIDGCDRSIGKAREQWISTNGEVFTGGNCVTCGQQLPADKLQKAKDSFEARKKKRLAEIEESANSFKESKAQAEDRLQRQQEEHRLTMAAIQELQQQIDAAEAALVEPRDMEHYAENAHSLNEKISRLNGELADIVMDSNSAVMKLRADLAEIIRLIATQQAIISKESLLAYSRERIEELRTDARNAAECLEAIEKMLYLMESYSRYKTQFVEDSINGMFRIARFRLFREQANGGIEDRCDVVHDGVPYISVNNGMKINLGIDIINTLSMAYGVRVPLFVDNAESVTQLEHCNSQIIRLVVSEHEKELSVHYEN
jgi:DNA repair exonuclease SbcCD ATPase subunit